MTTKRDFDFNQPLLDAAVVNSLVQLGQRRGRDLLGQLVGLFAEQGPKSFLVLHKALEDGNAESLRETAHSLKGSYRSLGTTRLAAQCEVLENRGREGDLEGMLEVVKALEVDFQSTLAALKSHLAEQSPGTEKP